jgi:hypothetical protein
VSEEFIRHHDQGWEENKAEAGELGRYTQKPDELRAFSLKTGLHCDALAPTSRLTALVDNNTVADGFQLYLHSFAITKSGEWAVVQQEINPENHLAQRYHWHSASVRDFVSEPHTAIVDEPQEEILNLVDTRAKKAQDGLLTVTKEPVTNALNDVRRLIMLMHHDVRAGDIDLKRLGAVLAVGHERILATLPLYFLVEGLGPRTMNRLRSCVALWMQLVLDIRKARRRRLDRLTRSVEEEREPLADFHVAIKHERRISPLLGGRTVFDDRPSRNHRFRRHN